jgi:hypothetical protein
MVLGAAVLIASSGQSGVLDASWTAPTTSTDGSPLTDLASYLVYYGASATPCPGSSFVRVSSTVLKPPPNQTVSLRLTNLTTGALYAVSVAAVDTSGNHGPCSASTSGIAQIDFTATPSIAVNFGGVNVGSSVTQVFTVESTRSGTVTGTASVSAPFSIVSGSPFTLSGAGATQAVTVRFAPTAPLSVSANVNFSADGDSISRLVTGIGLTADTTSPKVTITSPTSDPILTTGGTSLTLAGIASDNVAVTQVTWSNNRGGSGTATGTTTWTTGPIALSNGQNILTVIAWDAADNTSTATLAVTVSATTFTFTDEPLGPQSTIVKAIHLTELREAIDAARAARGLLAFAWTDPTITAGVTPIKEVHLTELRTALNQAYLAAGRVVPAYTDPAVGTSVLVKAIHFSELRIALRTL